MSDDERPRIEDHPFGSPEWAEQNSRLLRELEAGQAARQARIRRITTLPENAHLLNPEGLL